jgi:flagellar export protein FliJ
MKKFKYKIEAYLKFLKFQRENQLKEVEKAKQFKMRLENKYLAMESSMKKSYETNSQFGSKITDINLIHDNNNFISMLKQQMQDLSQDIAEAEEQYQDRYKKLLKLQIEVKKIELHKEQKREIHRIETNKKMQKQTDEINSSRKRDRDAKPL